jgi:hypothetical protein
MPDNDNLDPTPENLSPSPDANATPALWFDKLDPDLRNNPGITKFKSEADLAKSYVELQKALGKDKVTLPTDKSTPDELKAFWKKIGAPEKPEDYDIGDEDIVEQARLDFATKEQFRKAMYEEGYTKKQFDAAWKFYKQSTNNRITQEVEAIKKMRDVSETELRGKWGAAYEAKVEGAQKVINSFFKDKGVRKEFEVLANDKGFIEAMADIAERLGEDKIGGRARATLTPNEAQAELNTMMMDKKGPLYNELDPAHDAAVDRFAELQQMATQ